MNHSSKREKSETLFLIWDNVLPIETFLYLPEKCAEISKSYHRNYPFVNRHNLIALHHQKTLIRNQQAIKYKQNRMIMTISLKRISTVTSWRILPGKRKKKSMHGFVRDLFLLCSYRLVPSRSGWIKFRAHVYAYEDKKDAASNFRLMK